MVISTVSNAVVATAADSNFTNIETSINRSVISLCQIIRDFSHKKIELIRICRVAVLLRESGVNIETSLFKNIAASCIKMQRDDGGWSDVTETIWCTYFLDFFNEFSSSVKKALKWLSVQSNVNGGWGKSKRDLGRIPITGLIQYFLSQLSSHKHLIWMEEKWCQELEFKPCLSYKAAFTLMAFSKNKYRPENVNLISETLVWLLNQQNDDGGWGPWKDHPVGSDPWCTGICMIALLQYPDKVTQKTLVKSLKWLRDRQLPNGLWPYHYIEEGSVWALLSMVKGYRLFNG